MIRERAEAAQVGQGVAAQGPLPQLFGRRFQPHLHDEGGRRQGKLVAEEALQVAHAHGRVVGQFGRAQVAVQFVQDEGAALPEQRFVREGRLNAVQLKPDGVQL